MMKNSEFLLNVRLCFFSLAFIHLVVAAILILSIDMSNDSDPRVSAYIFVRWRLITCWFNLISLVYMPMCLYCEWRAKQGRADEERVVKVRKLKDTLMTSILFPTIMYADTLFWRLWYTNKELIAPIRIFDYLPHWAHHSLHTVSMVVVILDLLLVPRKRPRNLVPGLAVMSGFFATYSLMLLWSYRNGAVVYSVFEYFDSHKIKVLVLYSYIECLFYFMTQWCIVDLVWGRRKTTNIKSQ